MNLELLTPWRLWGAGARAAPLLIHLLTRAAQRTVMFPTLQFLRRTLARQSKLLRLRHLVLLLLRMLLLALLTVIIGLMSEPFFKLATEAAEQLLNPAGYIHAVLEGIK